MEQQKIFFITFLSCALMAGFGFLAGKGQMLPSEPYLSPSDIWAAIQKILGWNSAFHLQQGVSY